MIAEDRLYSILSPRKFKEKENENSVTADVEETICRDGNKNKKGERK